MLYKTANTGKKSLIARLENTHPQELKALKLIANDKAHKEVSKELDISRFLLSKRLRSLGKKTGSKKAASA